MTISIITLFPEVFEPVLSHSILKRAQKKGLINFKLVNLRDFGIGPHKIVDDRPYGGGAGMVLRVDVMAEAINKTRLNTKNELVVLLDPQGEVYHQETAEKLSKLDHLILICGHYEGFDERIRNQVDLEISVGDYVLTGGEIPAMAIMDSVTRLIPGVLKNDTATKFESFSEIDGRRILEGPSYTRPEVFGEEKVPDVLLSGDPKKIEEYKKSEAIKATKLKRPDLNK